MIVHNVRQGSPEWRALRSGRPTASQFHRIVTPAKLEASASQRGYLQELVAEMILGHPLEDVTTALMDRGSSLESEARNFYRFVRERDAEMVGFCTTDDGGVGASPDSLVGDDGLLEIKCPKPETHVGYMYAAADGGKGVDGTYWIQVQGQLYVTGRQWCDVLSYCPGLPEALVRVERDEKTQEALALHLGDFCKLLEHRRLQAIERGWLVPTKPEPPANEMDWLGITEADIEGFLEARRASA